jgi:hypothetical protein
MVYMQKVSPREALADLRADMPPDVDPGESEVDGERVFVEDLA